jgi:hypothetical protein
MEVVNMKINYMSNVRGFFIFTNYNNYDLTDDNEIASLLNMGFDEYETFLIKNNAYYDKNELFFKTQDDCEKCIKKLKEKNNKRLIYLTLTEKI